MRREKGRGPPATIAAVVLFAGCQGGGPDTALPARVVAPGDPAGFQFDATHSTDEIERTFEALARAHPRWMRSGSLGTSVEGRRIPYLEVTDGEAKAPKAGMWIDGAIHGHELGSAEPALGVTELLRQAIARGEPPELLTRVVLYLVPVINVDARRVATEPPYLRQRSNLAPVDDDGDGALDEDPYADINGDGHVMMMWATLPDGTQNRQYESRDQDGDGRCGEDPLGGIDLNRNFPVARDSGDVAGGPLQPETGAIVRFWLDHPEIELAISFHTSTDGYVLPPVPIRPQDAPCFESMVSIYTKATGHGELTGSVFSVLAPRNLRGISSEWFYSVQGATAFSIEVEVPEPPLMARASAVHDCLGQVEVLAIPPDSPLTDRSHLQLPMEEAEVLRHARYLIEMADSLPLRR